MTPKQKAAVREYVTAANYRNIADRRLHRASANLLKLARPSKADGRKTVIVGNQVVTIYRDSLHVTDAKATVI